MPQSFLGPYRIEAVNTAKESENKIHDDQVARRFGFKGGLVPGVEVYAYMTHLPVARWGREWLEGGTAECRLLKPVYDGDMVTVTASETADGLDLRLESSWRIVRHWPCRAAVCAIDDPLGFRGSASTRAPPDERPPPMSRPCRSAAGSQCIRSEVAARRGCNTARCQ